ncbi:MAG: hypothetical protein V4617_21175 [Gemmatimonadota bacterium]
MTIARLPANLPKLLAAGGFLSVLALALGGWQVAQSAGRGSSTDALALFFVPLYALIVATGGYVIGLALRALLQAPQARDWSRSAQRVATVVVLVIAPVLAFITAIQGTRNALDLQETIARPRVLVSTPEVTWRPIAGGVANATTPADFRYSELVWVSGLGTSIDSAAIGLPEFALDGSEAGRFTRGPQRSAPIDLSALDRGVQTVSVLSLGDAAERPGYVAMIEGSGRRRRSVVVVLDTALQLLHAEVVEPWWGLSAEALCIDTAAGAVAPRLAILGGCSSGSREKGRVLQFAEALPSPAR